MSDLEGFLPKIHLLTPDDLAPPAPAGEVVRADGTRQPVSAALLATIEHLLVAVEADRSVLVRPLAQRQWLVDAAALTDLGESGLRALVDEGRLATSPSEVGDIVELKDVVAVDEDFKRTREAGLQAMFDETFTRREPDQGDGA